MLTDIPISTIKNETRQKDIVITGTVDLPSRTKESSRHKQHGNLSHQKDVSDSLGKLNIDIRERKKKLLRSNSRKDKLSKPIIHYDGKRIIDRGSFGVVYQATATETGETVAIKKVLQDKRFKNRELQIMKMLKHSCVVSFKDNFYSKDDTKKGSLFLYLVMEYIPETLYRTIRNHRRMKKRVPIILTKVYTYQVARSLAYIHSLGICHRDIKPQNLLLNPSTHEVKLCDFGSAKVLRKGEPNVAYICSRYYRAPELVFESRVYTSAVDVWSCGCILAELLLGSPIFPGDSAVDQLVEIIKILGTPSREEIKSMNPNHASFKFPEIKPHPWAKVFKNKATPGAMDLVSHLLRYDPSSRTQAFEILCHPYFDELRSPNIRLPNSKPLPSGIFDFTKKELQMAENLKLKEKLIPHHLRRTSSSTKYSSSRNGRG